MHCPCILNTSWTVGPSSGKRITPSGLIPGMIKFSVEMSWDVLSWLFLVPSENMQTRTGKHVKLAKLIELVEHDLSYSSIFRVQTLPVSLLPSEFAELFWGTFLCLFTIVACEDSVCCNNLSLESTNRFRSNGSKTCKRIEKWHERKVKCLILWALQQIHIFYVYIYIYISIYIYIYIYIYIPSATGTWKKPGDAKKPGCLRKNQVFDDLEIWEVWSIGDTDQKYLPMVFNEIRFVHVSSRSASPSKLVHDSPKW